MAGGEDAASIHSPGTGPGRYIKSVGAFLVGSDEAGLYRELFGLFEP